MGIFSKSWLKSGTTPRDLPWLGRRLLQLRKRGSVSMMHISPKNSPVRGRNFTAFGVLKFLMMHTSPASIRYMRSYVFSFQRNHPVCRNLHSFGVL